MVVIFLQSFASNDTLRRRPGVVPGFRHVRWALNFEIFHLFAFFCIFDESLLVILVKGRILHGKRPARKKTLFTIFCSSRDSSGFSTRKYRFHLFVGAFCNGITKNPFAPRRVPRRRGARQSPTARDNRLRSESVSVDAHSSFTRRRSDNRYRGRLFVMANVFAKVK